MRFANLFDPKTMAHLPLRADAWRRLAVTLAAMYACAGIGHLLAPPGALIGLFAPAAGLGLALTRLWGPPALAGVVLGTLAAALWPAAPLLGLASGAAAALPLAAVIAVAHGLLAALPAEAMRAGRQRLAEGRLNGGELYRRLLAAGVGTALLAATLVAWASGWTALDSPFAAPAPGAVAGHPGAAGLLLWLSLWLGWTLSLATAIALVALFELRQALLSTLGAGAGRGAGPLHNPWLLIAVVAVPAWLLAGSLSVHATDGADERHRGHVDAAQRHLQAALDAGTVPLAALQALYRVEGAVAGTPFKPLAAALLAPRATAPADAALLGLAIVARPATHGAAAAGAASTVVVLRPDGRLGAGAYDFADHPGLLSALRRATPERAVTVVLPTRRNGTAAELGLPAAAAPAPVLLVGLGLPQGGTIAALLEPAALLAEAAPLLPDDNGYDDGLQLVLLDAASGGVLAERTLAASGASPAAANATVVTAAEAGRAPISTGNRLATERKLQLGDRALLLRALGPGDAAFAEPLWWFGQLLPQLLVLFIAALLMREAGRERALLELERESSTLMERQPHLAGAVGGELDAEAADFDPAGGEGQAKRFDLLIEQAWELRRFVPRFEPIVDLTTGQVRGVEALLRWPDAPPGLITPDVIEWAERKQRIGVLDERILADSLAALSRWPLARGQSFTVAVNVSANELLDPEWAGRIVRALDAAGVAGKRLCLEITEGVLLRPDAVVLSQLGRLRAAGVKLALDDFGTGYSSIGYLRQLPVDRLKLDRMFISGLAQDTKAREIVASVVRLARSLGVEVVAEGVEDALTAEALLQIGCNLAQGWLFSKAVGGKAVGRWLGSGTPLYPDHVLQDLDFELDGE